MNLIEKKYRIEKIENSCIAYKLHGQRGACHKLIRYQKNPEYMFVINKYGNMTNIAGNSIVTDKNGKLELVSYL